MTHFQNSTETVGAVAARLAGATAIFRKYKIGFCCDGDRTLDDAARAHGIDPSELRRELAALSVPSSEVPTDSGALVRYIVARYHDTHRRELEELLRLARRVEAVHRDHPEVPTGLADLLERAYRDLEDHMQKEERILCPAIASGTAGPFLGPISVMRHEHDDHMETIGTLQAICRGFEPPAGACRSWQALYCGLEKLTEDLLAHIALENGVLFPRFEAARS